MALVVEVTNAFNPQEDLIYHNLTEQISIQDWLVQRFGSFTEFPHPTICLLNGSPLLRAQWGYQIKDTDTVTFVRLAPGDPLTIFAVVLTVVMVAATIYYMNNIPKPNGGQLPDRDPVYSLTGQANSIKLMSPIEVPYGRVRLWPSYASRSYNKFENDDQMVYSLFVLGQGYYSIEKIQVEDTELSAFQDIETEIIEPGGKVTLFPDNVVTSVEVASIELFGPNEAEYTGWSGGYVVNPAGTKTNRIEIDRIYPMGLYSTNDKGDLQNISVTTEFQYREVDDIGSPIGDWVLLDSITHTNATVQTKRYTTSVEVFPARYEVRGRRTSEARTDHKASDTVHWASLRGFLPDTKDYGNITLLAVKARASNNLNDSAANRFNVIATRKLPTWNPTNGWSTPTATRSIVWAFCDIFTAAYGGKLGSDYLDLDYLYSLDQSYLAKGYFFDWTFDQKSTIWDAARICARAGRAVPMLNGSLITMVVDEPKTLPVAVFNQDNIVRDSFRWDIRLFEMNATDSVEIEYTDPVTWNPEEVLCVLPNSEGLDPEKVKLSGCTNRAQAYREGMYIASSTFYIRENITFSTGLEGHIPTYGDLISVSHDLPRWGQSGVIFNKNGRFLDLSEPVEFTDSETHYIVLRKKDGSAAGPFEVVATSDDHIVELAQDIETELYFDGIREYPLFQFGVADKWAKLCKVVSINPSNGEEIEIICTNYDDRVFAYDEASAPPLDSRQPPTIPDLPVVSGLLVRSLPDTVQFVLVSWNPALGATAYIIQQSPDGVNWDNVSRVSTTSYTLPVQRGYLYVRVAGINAGAGPWNTWQGEVGYATTIPPDISGLSLQQPFSGTYAKIQWDSVVSSTGYIVRVYRQSDNKLLRTTPVAGQTFTYSAENALEDAAYTRNYTFTVVAVNNLGESSTPAEILVSNPKPAKVTGISSELKTQTDTTKTYKVEWYALPDVDIIAYRVWGSTTSGFTPTGANLIYEGTAIAADVTFDKIPDVPMYYIVAAVDIWDDAVNYSDQHTLGIN